MKINHIILLVVVAVAIAIIMSTSADAGKYADFTEAFSTKAESASFHVIGALDRGVDGKAKNYVFNPQVDPNYFSFKMKDEKGLEKEVVYLHPMPQDFGNSEKIVVIGQADGEVFHAEKILLKCPSKYKEGEFKEATI